jgi:hypothetical protein
MLEYNIGKRLENKLFHFIYKVGDWSIFVEMNVMYMCTQKTQIHFKNNLKDF